MAIAHARARYISRSSGGSVVRSAAYIARAEITSELTGEAFSFKDREAADHLAVMLPEGAAERFRALPVLANAMAAAEKRKDSQEARELVLALPRDGDVSDADRIELARSFAQQHFVDKGLAVVVAVHDLHGQNPHAHLLVSTRRLDGAVFAAKKAIDLEPTVRTAAGKPRVADGAEWGKVWAAHQDRYFLEHGIAVRTDPVATVPQAHIGPNRFWRAGENALRAQREDIRLANSEAAQDPEQVLATLTRTNATFSERDLDRHLAKHLDTAAERAAVKGRILEHQDVVPLLDPETAEPVGRFTTRAVREQETIALADGAVLARSHGAAVAERAAIEALARRRPLREDQAAAFDHATGPARLAIVEGRAGVGKSVVANVARDAYERAGWRVIGLAPTNTVAQDLARDGFREARTVHSELFRLKNQRGPAWNAHTVLIVDEAAMLSTPILGEVLATARQAGAKVVLAGDDRQLASIERGGLFTELCQRHGSAEITEVVRQRVDWQRQAARDLAEGRFGEAVAAFDQAGAITWTKTQDDAGAALVRAWAKDAAARPGATRFVFAFTNADVDALNDGLRTVRRARGELGPDVTVQTRHGPAPFAVNDRVQFTDTAKKLGLYNGAVATITGLNARTGEVRATLDGGRQVAWGREFQGIRHGYAGTIYRGQGKTLDRTYVLHDRHWRSSAAYVALTRQRESVSLFVARETASDGPSLARQMARTEVKAASVAWATREELPARLRPAPERERAPDAAVQKAIAEREAMVERMRVRRELRPELEKLNRDALAGIAREDQGSFWGGKPLSVEDVARRQSPAYAAAADRAEKLRKDVEKAAREAVQVKADLEAARTQAWRRWEHMGTVRRVGHRTGVLPDPILSARQHDAAWAEEKLARLTPEAEQLGKRLAEAEKAAQAAFRKAEPRAAAELGQRQERAALAREIERERRAVEIAQEKLQPGIRHRRGPSLGR